MEEVLTMEKDKQMSNLRPNEPEESQETETASPQEWDERKPDEVEENEPKADVSEQDSLESEEREETDEDSPDRREEDTSHMPDTSLEEKDPEDFDIDLVGEARESGVTGTAAQGAEGQGLVREQETAGMIPDGRISPAGQRLLPRKTLWTMLLTAVLVGALLSFALFYAALPTLLQIRGISLGGSRENNGPSVVINPSEDLSVYSAVAQKAMPSVVGITTVQTRTGLFSGSQRSEGLGTGVIVDDRGYILTNSHVILDGQADEVMVLLHDGSQLPAEVLWYEQAMDLAVIKIEGGVDLIPAELGDSDHLIVGEIVVAIGNPLGLNFERTLTQGVVSGLNRSIPVAQSQIIDNLIQTDASINPGNSGGPLLNARGQVIGINTAKMRTGEGLGFAIPINTSKPIVDQFIERGEFRRVYLGIRGFNAENVEGATGVPISVEKGVYIVEVVPESAAAAADLRPGDVVIRLGEVTVDTMGNLIRELYKYRPGDTTTVTYVRNGQEETVEIRLRD